MVISTLKTIVWFYLIFSMVEARVTPFVYCTVNDGSRCTTVWGYESNASTTLVLPLNRNKFSPAPVYRGQPTTFKPMTTVYEAFTTTTPCSSGALTWSLTDPNTNTVYSATSNTITGDTCTPLKPLYFDCSDENAAVQKLAQCRTLCGDQCSFCGQVYSYCRQVGMLYSNFTLDACMIITAGFDPVSTDCDYNAVVQTCCRNVEPPVESPISVPSEEPVSPPFDVPIDVPVSPPLEVPVSPPVESPISPPIEPPFAPPIPLPASTAVCSFGAYQQGYACMLNAALGSNCTQRVDACIPSMLANFDYSESIDCAINAMTSSNNTVDCDYVDKLNICCGVNRATSISCNAQSDCPPNTVCTGRGGSCSGIQGALCSSDRDCSYAYSCRNGVCTNADPLAFPATITGCPSAKCNATFSIALQETLRLNLAYGCSNPNFIYATGTPYAYFFMPATNATFDTLNVTFTTYLPYGLDMDVRVLTQCNINGCDRSLNQVRVAQDIYQFNHFYDYNQGGVTRGYIFFVKGNQFPPMNGIIVNVTTQCINYEAPSCSMVVNQTCNSPLDCPSTAPYCNASLKKCQALRGGACLQNSDCETVQGLTCDRTTCTCVGGNSGVCETAQFSTYQTQIGQCVRSIGGSNCTYAVKACSNNITGDGVGGGITDADKYSRIYAQAIIQSTTQYACEVGSSAFYQCAGTKCGAVTLQSCQTSRDCTGFYPFCDGGICRGASGAPCSNLQTNSCQGGIASCDIATCSCKGTTQGCDTFTLQRFLANKLESCFATKNGTCRDRMYDCMGVFTGFPALTDSSALAAITSCIGNQTPPGCASFGCVNNGCSSTVVPNCKITEECPCGSCCGLFTCETCSEPCTRPSDCPEERPYCASVNNRCTSNPLCGPGGPLPLTPKSIITPIAVIRDGIEKRSWIQEWLEDWLNIF